MLPVPAAEQGAADTKAAENGLDLKSCCPCSWCHHRGRSWAVPCSSQKGHGWPGDTAPNNTFGVAVTAGAAEPIQSTRVSGHRQKLPSLARQPRFSGAAPQQTTTKMGPCSLPALDLFPEHPQGMHSPYWSDSHSAPQTFSRETFCSRYTPLTSPRPSGRKQNTLPAVRLLKAKPQKLKGRRQKHFKAEQPGESETAGESTQPGPTQAASPESPACSRSGAQTRAALQNKQLSRTHHQTRER